MKHLVSTVFFALVVVLVAAPVASAGSDKKGGPDPGKYLYPPQLVAAHGVAIGLTEPQRKSLESLVQKTSAELSKKQLALSGEAGKLMALLAADTVDEAKIIAQARRVMALETEVKVGHLTMLVRVKALLTPKQRRALDRIKQGGRP